MPVLLSPRALVAALALSAASLSIAADIELPPATPSFNHIAANVPAGNNHWTGLAQSFVAQASQVEAGFYLLSNLVGTHTVQYSLYAGDGSFTSLLHSARLNFVAPSAGSRNLLLHDFSSTLLTPGQSYTLVVSDPWQALPPSGQYSAVGAAYAGTAHNGNPNPYPDGRFYFVGSPYNQALFADRDLALAVRAVPEPASALLLLSGCGLFAARRLRRG